MHAQLDAAVSGVRVSNTSTSDTRHLVIYARTSTHNGAGGDSLDAQEEACRAWAAANHHEIVGVHRDQALSGGLGIEDRPGLGAAIVALEQAAADGIVVHRIDRLARELHVQEVALAHAWGVGGHVAVFEAAEGGEVRRDDPADPHRRFLRQVMGAAGSSAGSSKPGCTAVVGAKRGQEASSAEGRCTRSTAMCWSKGCMRRSARGRRSSSGSSASAEGATWAAIASALAEDGAPPPRGAAWYPATARRICRREIERTHA